MSYRGTFIQPSSCSLRLATDSLVLEEALARDNVSEKCRTYSVGRPQVAGRDGPHLGWHTTWHSVGERGIYH